MRGRALKFVTMLFSILTAYVLIAAEFGIFPFDNAGRLPSPLVMCVTIVVAMVIIVVGRRASDSIGTDSGAQ